MSDVTDIEDAFEDYVFKNSTVAGISPVLFKYEVRDVSEKESGALLHNQEVNFWELVVSRDVGAKSIGSVSQAQLMYPVEIRYSKQIDTEGETFRAVRDAFVSLTSTVESVIGQQWNSTVDYFNHQEGPPDIEQAPIAGIDCFRGVYRFFGFKFSSI